jgi:hypothetical protein
MYNLFLLFFFAVISCYFLLFFCFFCFLISIENTLTLMRLSVMEGASLV